MQPNCYPLIACHQNSRSIVVSLVRIVCSMSLTVNSGFSLGQPVQISSICLQETSFQAMRLNAVHSLHVPVGLPPLSGFSSSIGVARGIAVQGHAGVHCAAP